jgi:hypothetical protein
MDGTMRPSAETVKVLLGEGYSPQDDEVAAVGMMVTGIAIPRGRRQLHTHVNMAKAGIWLLLLAGIDANMGLTASTIVRQQ